MLYDLAVVGGGAAGCKAAEAAASAGLSTIILEKAQLGGNTFRAGSTPMGLLLRELTLFQARALDKATVFPLAEMTSRVQKQLEVQRRRQQQTLAELGVEAQTAAISFGTPTADSFTLLGQELRVQAKNVLLATGSLPAIAHLPSAMNAIEYGTLLTSGQPLLQGNLPESILIVGSNMPSLQWAAILSASGCKVTLLDSRFSCYDTFGKETSTRMIAHLRDMGVRFLVPAKLADVGFGYAVLEMPDGTVRFGCERVLFCRYRLPVTRGMGLATIGLRRMEGAVITDDRCRASLPSVYAAGDCNGKTYTVQAAYREAETAVANICGIPAVMRYNAVPYFMEALGEVASVGMTTDVAAKNGIKTKTASLPLPYADARRYEDEGHVTLVQDDKTGALIGAHLMGDGACHAVRLLTTAIEAAMDPLTARRYITPDNLATETVRSVLLMLTKEEGGLYAAN